MNVRTGICRGHAEWRVRLAPQSTSTLRYVRVGCRLLELLLASPEGLRILMDSGLVAQVRRRTLPP